MSEFNTFTGKTVDDAISEACRFFATERDKLEVEILSGGSTGIFGLVGKKKAQVRARRRVDPGLAALIREEERQEAQAAKPERAPKPAAPARSDSGGKAPRAAKAEPASGSDTDGNEEPRSQSSPDVLGGAAAPGAAATPARAAKPGAPAHGSNGGREALYSSDDEVSFNRAEPPVDQDTLDAEDERAAIAAGQKAGSSQPQARREEGRRGGQPSARGRKPRDFRQERQRRQESQPRGESGPAREARRELPDAEDSLPEGQDQSPASPELLAQVREVMVRLLTPILEQEPQMEIEGTASRVNVLIMDEEHSGLLIGREGQTLAALQYLANRIVARIAVAPVRVQINTGEYREKQDDSLRKMALYLADKAKNLGRPQSTKPLSSYHRRVIHLALQADETIQTRSKGEGPMKRVIIVPRRPKAEAQPQQ